MLTTTNNNTSYRTRNQSNSKVRAREAKLLTHPPMVHGLFALENVNGWTDWLLSTSLCFILLRSWKFSTSRGVVKLVSERFFFPIPWLHVCIVTCKAVTMQDYYFLIFEMGYKSCLRSPLLLSLILSRMWNFFLMVSLILGTCCFIILVSLLLVF